MDWYQSLKKSPLTPPNKAFSIVWPILYLMMAISAGLMWKNPKCPGFCTPLIFFSAQLILNLMWTQIFFKQRNIRLALMFIIAILGLTIYTIYLFYPIDRVAAMLLIPYAAWLMFALYLNWYIYANN